jgi:hypothetical protein
MSKLQDERIAVLVELGLTIQDVSELNDVESSVLSEVVCTGGGFLQMLQILRLSDDTYDIAEHGTLTRKANQLILRVMYALVLRDNLRRGEMDYLMNLVKSSIRSQADRFSLNS